MSDLGKIYIDSCCFVDMAKTEIGRVLDTERREDVWYLKKLLEASRDREVEVYTSTLTIAECSHGGDNDISEGVKSAFNRLLMSGQYVRLVQLTPFIAQDARDLRWIHRITLRGADAAHIASALAMKCDEFISSNGRFTRVNNHRSTLSFLGLSVRNARDTQSLPEKYKQLGITNL